MMPEKKRIQRIMEIKIKKVHTLLDLVISAVVLAAGVGVYFILPGWGILFGLIGILLFAFYKRSYRRVGDRTSLKQKDRDLALESRDAVMEFLQGKSNELALSPAGEGDHLWLDVYYNADSAVAYAQLYDVAENRFDPATQLVELKGEKARKLIAQL